MKKTNKTKKGHQKTDSPFKCKVHSNFPKRHYLELKRVRNQLHPLLLKMEDRYQDNRTNKINSQSNSMRNK
jgi:hypothetical protein